MKSRKQYIPVVSGVLATLLLFCIGYLSPFLLREISIYFTPSAVYLSQSIIHFGTVSSKDIPVREITISSNSSKSLTFTQISDCKCVPPEYTIPPKGKMNLMVTLNVTQQASGNITQDVWFVFKDSSQKSLKVTLYGSVR